MMARDGNISSARFGGRVARQKAHDVPKGQEGQEKILVALSQVSQAMSQIYEESLL